jgi:hypothetical protein
MAKVTLGKTSFDLPDSIANGDVAKTLKEASSALAEYAKSGKGETLFKLLDKILKTAIPNDLKKAKGNKDAKECLDEVKETVEKIKDAYGKVAKVEKGAP